MTTVSDFSAILGGTSWTWVSQQMIPTTGTPVILTYSFPTEPQPSYFNKFGSAANSFVAFNDADKGLARAALDAWASVSGITFIETSGASGDLRLSWLDFSQLADASLRPFSGLGYSPFAPFYVSNSTIYPQTEEYWLTQNTFFDFGGDTFYYRDHINSTESFQYVLLHEIGHALGLKHSFVGDIVLAPALDKYSNTVMSYTRDSPGTVLGPLDVAAAQYLYGLPSQDGTQFSSWSFDAATETIRENGTAANDLIRGTGTRDIIDGGAGNDVIYAASGNDFVIGGLGLDFASGGVGVDTYSVGVSRSFGNLTKDAFSGMTIRVLEGYELIRDFERVLYTDSLVAYDIQGNAGNAYRLYQAAFNRVPDTGGLSFWTHGLDIGIDIQEISRGFVNSAEFKQVYGANPTNSHIIDLFYQNVLGRAGEPGGVAYWLNALNIGVPVSEVLQGFAVSAENHAIVDSKLALGIVLDSSAFLI